MPTPKRNNGKDFDFYKKIAVSNTDWAEVSDISFTFPTHTVMMWNEGSGSTNVVEYSLNGNTLAGELDPTKDSKTLVFPNRRVNAIWFRLKNGSNGTVTVRVDAWSTQ